MPPKTQPWFRFYVEAVHDRKIRRLKPEHRWIWVALLAAAKRSPIDGYLLIGERQSLDEHDLADIAAVAVRSAKSALAEFDDAGMIAWDDDVGAWYVTKWKERQFASDTSTERTRRHRSRNDEETTMERSNDVPSTFDGTPPDTETDTETENPSVTSADAAAGFDDFWQQYPARDGKKLERGKALAVWKRLSKTKRSAAMTGIEHYADSGTKPKDAHRWLRDECWTDWQTPAVPDRPNGTATPPKQVVQ